MTVYVDDMYKHAMGRFRYMKMSHMIADTDEELHAMADKITLNRKWYQGDHYDVSMGYRQRALANGAVAITMRQLSAMCMLKRTGQPMGDPLTAVDRMLEAKGYKPHDKPKPAQGALDL